MVQKSTDSPRWTWTQNPKTRLFLIGELPGFVSFQLLQCIFCVILAGHAKGPATSCTKQISWKEIQNKNMGNLPKQAIYFDEVERCFPY